MRQYILPKEPDTNGNIMVSGKDFKYLNNVLRLRPGMYIDARLPSGMLVQMCIESIDLAKKTILLQIATSDLVSTGGQRALVDSKMVDTVLLQWLPKLSKMDDIVRQAVETGVTAIIPVISTFSPKEAQTAMSRMERWQRIIKEARQQSGSPVATRIFEPQTVAHALETWNNLSDGKTRRAMYLSEENRTSNSLHGLLDSEFQSVGLAVGSEGGYAPSEIEQLDVAGFLPLHFSTNILRAETAAIYGLASLQTVRTELHIWKK